MMTQNLDLEWEIDAVTEKAKDIGWEDISSLLHFDTTRALQESKLMLVGRLLWRKIHLKQIIFFDNSYGLEIFKRGLDWGC